MAFSKPSLCLCVLLTVLSWQLSFSRQGRSAEKSDLTKDLIGHWPLMVDGRDASSHGLDAKNHSVVWEKSPQESAAIPQTKPVPFANQKSARFNGRDAVLQVATSPALRLGRGNFSVAAWIHTDEDFGDVPGDIVSLYDGGQRRGFHFALKTNAGVTFNQANFRHLQFGIDADRISEWRDCGRPGRTSIVPFALAAHEGQLYAGTCEPGQNESGRVYRYAGGQEWVDCGAPGLSNAITAMAVFGGQLYVGTGKYRLGGSSLTESDNPNLGGKVFRYEGGTRWTDCGQLPNSEAVSGLVVFRDRLYAGSLYRPAGFFRYDGDAKWADVGTPNGKRVEALGVFNGHLYATCYDEGHVFRFDGQSWTDCGQLGEPTENTQTYSFAVYEGRLYVGTWRTGRVYRFEDIGRWTDVGRLGEELEVMGMLVHNGRLIAGTLPLAEVYSFDGGSQWRKLTRLDLTPDVKYRRAWTLAEFQGQLFCGTLPSGKVHACEVGKNVSWDHELARGWHHVTGIKDDSELRLFVDGQLKSRSSAFNSADFDLSVNAPLQIGSGPNDFFNGHLRDVRLYRRALSPNEVEQLAKPD